ncbi:MAG: hypothetical protein KGI27_03090 [Thaumarchaeota archaeon]|nr:hypothetical protein [Nitrososphaerota archaeon]
MEFQLLNIKKINKWIFIPIILAILGSTSFEATRIHDSELFIASVTMLALVCWITFVSLCVAGVGRILK